MRSNQSKRDRFYVSVMVVIFSIAMFGGVRFLFKLNDIATSSEIQKQTQNTDVMIRKLEKMAKQNPKIKQVIEHYSSYPKEVIKLLIKNPESIDFVLKYLDENKEIYDTLHVKLNTVPTLYQWDVRYGYAQYGDGYLGFTGCAPTVVSMAAMYLLQDTSLTPPAVAKIAEENGYYVEGQGTAWSFILDLPMYMNVYTSEISLDEQSIRNVLMDGGLVICSVKPGDFTSTGHFILIVGVAPDGSFIIRDPNSVKNTNKKWDYKRLQTQINGLWSIHSALAE